MRALTVCITMIFLLVALYTAKMYMESMSGIWQATAEAKMSLEIADAKSKLAEEQTRREYWTGFFRSALPLALAIVAATSGVLLWRKYDERREAWARAVDGMFPLQKLQSGPFTWLYDPNKNPGGMAGMHKPSGQVGMFNDPVIGPERQVSYAEKVQNTNTTVAMSANGKPNNAMVKGALGYYDKPAKPPMLTQTTEPEVNTWRPLSTMEAFEKSTSSKWIFGQSPSTGELFELNPKETVHFGVVGTNGAGKTGYTAILLMAYALKNKYRVIALDGKGGADWRKYDSIAEYHKLDYTNVGVAVKQMWEEHVKRQSTLNEYSANSIWELPVGVGKPRPTVIIIDEFGFVMDSLKAASKTSYKSTELDLSNLLRLGRSSGLYVVLCDQNPSKWPDTVRANMPVNLCYRLGGGIGNSVQEYNLDRLNRVGQFQVSNTIYNAFPTYEVIDKLLPGVDYRKPLALLTLESTGIVEGGGVLASDPTLLISTSTTDLDEFTPVDNTSTGTGTTPSKAKNTSTGTGTKDRLEGRPITAKDKNKIRNVYALTGSINETCRVLWGSKTPSRMQWVKEIIEGDKLQ